MCRLPHRLHRSTTLTVLPWIVSILVAAPLRAGDFGEHKYIGDAAFKRLLATHADLAAMAATLLDTHPLANDDPAIPIASDDPSHFYRHSMYDGLLPITTLDGKALSYGDLTALSGDHSANFLDLMNQTIAGSFYGGAASMFKELLKDLTHEYRDELENLNDGGRGFNPIVLEFLSLAGNDRSHFHAPATPLRQELDKVSGDNVDLLRRLLYSNDPLVSVKAQLTLALFNVNVVEKYCILHTLARDYFTQGFNQYQSSGVTSRPASMTSADSAHLKLARGFFLVAITANAFSEHYLQDMFAGGHLFADRMAIDPLGLEARGVHDYYGRLGVDARLNGGDIRLFGDGRYTAEQIAAAVDANVASMEDAFSTTLPSISAIDRLKALRVNPSEPVTNLFPALARVPSVPLGAEFARQQTLGRSISGFTRGVNAFASRTTAGLGYTEEMNIMLVRPGSPAAYEGIFGFGPRLMAEVHSEIGHGLQRVDGSFSLALDISLFDWIYANAGGEIGIRDGLGWRFEEGIQLKFIPWSVGVRLGVIERPNATHREPQVAISFMWY